MVSPARAPQSGGGPWGGGGEGVPPAPPCRSLETVGFLAVVAAATWAGAGSQKAWGGDGAPELNTVWDPQLPHLWGNVREDSTGHRSEVEEAQNQSKGSNRKHNAAADDDDSKG